MSHKLPPPRQSDSATWIVTVYDAPAEGADWSLAELGDLADQHGYGSNEYLDAAGPTDGFRPHAVYGPYTQKQARTVVDFVCGKDPKAVATATPLLRYIPAFTPDAPTEETDDE